MIGVIGVIEVIEMRPEELVGLIVGGEIARIGEASELEVDITAHILALLTRKTKEGM